MATWAFYSDSSLVTALTSLDATTYPTSTFRCWLGSTTTGRKLIAQSTGADIELSPADAATGTGHETTAVKIADTSGGLSTATAGAAFTIGGYLLGGAANAQELWVAVTDAVGDGVKSTELSLTLTACYETAT